jgi:hypothetical protein
MTKSFRFWRRHPAPASARGGTADERAVPEASGSTRRWDALDDEEQTELRIAFGYYLDGLSPTCSIETKVARFRDWLRERGIEYSGLPD